MDLSDTSLDKLVAESFQNVTTYDDMVKSILAVLYTPGMPKEKTRKLIADLLKPLVVAAPEQLSFNGTDLVQLLERMIHFVSINTWLFQQFCDDCHRSGTRCRACTNGKKIYKNEPQISISTFTVTGKPRRAFTGATSTNRSIEFSFTVDDPRAQDTLFESEFPEMDFETKLWLTDSWKALREQYEIDKDIIGKSRGRNYWIDQLRKSGRVHQLSILLDNQLKCLNCGRVRPNAMKKVYCSSECDEDFSQFYKDWTTKHKYEGDFKKVALQRLRAVLTKKRFQA